MGSRLLPEMRLCKKIFAAALCVLVVLPEPGCARTLWKRALLKMTEKYDFPAAEERPVPAAAAEPAGARLRGAQLPLRRRVRAPQALLLQRLHLRLPRVRAAPASLGLAGSAQTPLAGRQWVAFGWPRGSLTSRGLQHHGGRGRAPALPHGLRVPHHQPGQHGRGHPQQGPVHQAPGKPRWTQPEA
ncbi:WAP four-disulfide core domain protein 1 isoform X2 [Vidua chalybeata]|uniref:WAP four-disulfide core domain protein 1 isoform X2 n=1 Tax=Vidua chalybeata TaxID=81927 RepID=UPI0023A88E06|nr:WAP four-disulfide core domain protein 1 isoform X2 [Vidua chalybeata]